MSDRYVGTRRAKSAPARAGAVPRFRRRLLDIGMGLLIGSVVVGGAAFAIAPSDTIGCAPGEVIVVRAGNTWACQPDPAASPTPSPSATLMPSPSPSTTVAPSTTSPPASTTPPATTPPATTPPPSPSPTPTAPAGWPSPSTVGVPAGTVLTNYSGPCTITVPNTVLDARHISCTLRIQTTGVVIRRSIVDGGILTGRGNTANPVLKLTVEDSRLIGKGSTRGIDGSAYVVRRSHISGDTSGGWCWRSCLIEGNYIEAAGSHTSAFRLQRDGVMRGNVLWCKRFTTGTDGGCSADLVSYADIIDGQQTVIDNNVVTGNLFKATPGWYCMRAGNGSNWTVTGNTFEVGAGRCSLQSGGNAITNWTSGGGNLWTDNRYTDGRLVTV